MKLGAFLSRDGQIAVVSSLVTFIISTIVFFILGRLCGHRRKTPAKIPTPGPMYESVQRAHAEQELELKENITYGPVACIN